MTSPRERSFEEFFVESLPRVLARALVISVNRHDAEDAVQDAYAQALLRWGRLSGYDEPEAWLHRVVRQRLWKTSARWRRLSLDTVELRAWRATSGDPEQAVLVEAVLAAVAALPARQRQLVVMQCLHGMSQREIAEELGIRPGTVAAAVFNARKSLRESLGTVREQELLDRLAPAQVLAHAVDREPVEAVLEATAEWLARCVAAHGTGVARIRRNVGVR
ncbi:sigma-70 family RNA polymerase sigma factor [Actinokineospora auranticolor]|uniref:RNA polymerase sigma-70 factor (ECF subfamily) n=1 Tax=Actinokineospora auranticolor TaxID=155976 RepID=A0A2S6GEX2_9PSEU|nr:sigma-70 family RNA polymerase sigma factor [Actinokineospora auranticolor]PPK63691.1 RNA polymerase sigma-70 factor (ECF subfamily) [Actinokineospora auranticolor]